MIYMIISYSSCSQLGIFCTQGIFGNDWKHFWMSPLDWEGGRISYCHLSSGQRPGVSQTSYKTQDGPHNKEFSGSKCQSCWGWETFFHLSKISVTGFGTWYLGRNFFLFFPQDVCTLKKKIKQMTDIKYFASGTHKRPLILLFNW